MPVAAAAAPQSSGARDAYNQACVQALAGKKDAAVASLGRAAELGFSFTATMFRDPDLDSIRDHPECPAVVARIKANNARALEKFKVAAERGKVLVFPPAKGDPRKPAPLIVALHGSGGTADDFAPVWRRVASNLGAVLAVPQGLNPAGAGFDWGVAEQGSHLVLRAIEKARAEAAIDESRISGLHPGTAGSGTLRGRPVHLRVLPRGERGAGIPSRDLAGLSPTVTRLRREAASSRVR